MQTDLVVVAYHFPFGKLKLLINKIEIQEDAQLAKSDIFKVMAFYSEGPFGQYNKKKNGEWHLFCDSNNIREDINKYTTQL